MQPLEPRASCRMSPLDTLPPRRRRIDADRRGGAAAADLQCLPLLRRLLRGVSGDDAPARIRQGRRRLPGKPVPQLRRLPARLPVRAAARIRGQCSAGDGEGARADLLGLCLAAGVRAPVPAQRRGACARAGRRPGAVPGAGGRAQRQSVAEPAGRKFLRVFRTICWSSMFGVRSSCTRCWRWRWACADSGPTYRRRERAQDDAGRAPALAEATRDARA